MEKHPVGDLMAETIGKIKETVDSNTVVGKPIVVSDSLTLIPVTKVSFGFATGGTDFQAKKEHTANPFGGGSGAGVKMDPVAFIVIKDGNVRLMNVAAEEPGALDKLLDMAPELVDKAAKAVENAVARKKDAESAGETV